MLVGLGVSQSFPRSLTLRRSAVPPLALAGLSLMGVVAHLGGVPLAVLAWALGLSGAITALHGRVERRLCASRPSRSASRCPAAGCRWFS